MNKTSFGALKLWEGDHKFIDIMGIIRGKTLVDIERCHILYSFAKAVIGLSGNYAEVGVYKGGTARLISEVLKSTEKKFSIYDTFEGMPAVSPEDNHHKAGDFSDTSFESVLAFIGSDKVNAMKGRFPDSITDKNSSEKFCFVHVDVDIYQSVKDCIEWFYPRMVSGGVIIFDDYGFSSCEGAKKALDESGIPFVYLTTGQAIIIKS